MVDQQKLQLSTRLLPIAALGPVLLMAVFVASSPNFESTATVHWILQIFTGIFAGFCGILVLRSSILLPGNSRFILAIGLLGAAVLDICHGLLVSPSVQTDILNLLIPWGWLPSRVLLPTMLFFAIWVEIYESRSRPTGKILLFAIALPAAAFVLLCCLIMAFGSERLPQIYFPDLPVQRPSEIFPAALYFLALISQFYKGRWRNDVFEYNLLLVLVLGVITHSLFMPFAHANFTGFFAAAMIGKILGYVFLLSGLLLLAREGMKGETQAERVRHHSIVDTASDGIITFDSRGFIDTFNPAAERLFGYTAAEAIGQNITLLTTEVLRQEHDVILEKVRSGKLPAIKADSYEALGLHKDGSIFPVESAINQVNLGDKLLFTAIVRDITPRKAEQARLQEISERLALALEAAGLGSWEQDVETGELTWDKHMYKLYGLNIEAGPPSLDQLTDMSFPAEAQSYNEAHAITVKTGAPLDMAFRIRLPNDTIRWIKTDAKIVMDDKGKAQRLVGVNQDISASILYLEELENARKEADEANRAKSAFLATMSHEIRTPLNGVIGLTEVLQQTSLQSYQKDISDLIEQSAHSLLEIIEDILDLSKIEAGKLEIDPTHISVAGIVEEVCAMLTNLGDSAGTELLLYIDPEIPKTALGDGTRLRQILTNLINNAIKFSSKEEQPGRISVRVFLASSDADKDTNEIEFQVKDNGIGMDSATRSRLFSPFTQADASTSRKFGGTGLGLTISQRLAELMGGKISVESEPGQGSTFSITLPFQAVEEAQKNDTQNPASGHQLGDLTCLVVGGIDSQATDLSSYLAHAGARVVSADDLRAAQQVAEQYDANTILWVVEASEEKSQDSPLLQAVHTLPAVIVICSNKKLQFQMQEAQMEFLDGNVLLRKRFLDIVAEKAGVLPKSPSNTGTQTVQSEQPDIPSRQDAISNNKLILIAEDNPTNQQVILHQLSALGYQADIAGDGVEALKQWRTGEYALLLTDLQMPEMDGYELARALRKEEENERIPIIALTANTLLDEAENCKSAGMDDYLSKPASLADLRASIERWLPGAA